MDGHVVSIAVGKQVKHQHQYWWQGMFRIAENSRNILPQFPPCYLHPRQPTGSVASYERSVVVCSTLQQNVVSPRAGSWPTVELLLAALPAQLVGKPHLDRQI